jgi:hypothetical protein
MPDLNEFKGYFPYASELLGVYQPLLGWESRQTKERVDEERRALATEVLDGMMNDPHYEKAVEELEDLITPKDPGDPTPPLIDPTQIADYVREQGIKIQETEGRPPTVNEWGEILSSRKLKAALKEIKERATVGEKIGTRREAFQNYYLIPNDALSHDEFKKIKARRLEDTNYMVVSREALQPGPIYKKEAVIAGGMNWLSTNHPEVAVAVLR